MLKSNPQNLTLSRVLAPLVLLLAGVALIIYSLPGEGRNIPNAIGLLLVFSGAVWLKLIRYKASR